MSAHNAGTAPVQGKQRGEMQKIECFWLNMAFVNVYTLLGLFV